MLFSFVGNLVSRVWPALLVAWIGLLIVAMRTAPPWDQVVKHNDDEFFPADTPARQAEALFDRAFPGERKPSRVVIVVHREAEGGLSEQDKALITEELEPRLKQLAQADMRDPSIVGIQSFNDGAGGVLLNSADGKVSLVLVDLSHDFLDPANWPSVAAIEKVIDDLRRDGKVPSGLALDLTGSAVLGRDVASAEARSADATKFWTIVLVVTLLLLIYRAPLLIFIPLATVYVAVEGALKCMQLLAAMGLLRLFEGIQVYVIVLGYGAGVDYCLFLCARYREEMEEGASGREAVAKSVGKVGTALCASAATVIGGIGMMAFASFGKIRDAGIVIPISLIIVLAAALTFTPSLLCLAGRWVFWPRLTGLGRVEQNQSTGALSRVSRFWNVWDRIGRNLLRRPAVIWLACVTVLTPFAIIAMFDYDRLDYGEIDNVPRGSVSIAGTEALKAHFPPGIMGSTTILVENNGIDFRDLNAVALVKQLTDNLVSRRTELKLADIRTLDAPLGVVDKKATLFLTYLSTDVQEKVRSNSLEHYVGRNEALTGHVMRIELVFDEDPLATASIARLNAVERAVQDALPDGLRQGSRLFALGATASLRDLQAVTSHDQRLIGFLVPAAVLIVLMMLLRRLVISVYLVLSVLFSYLVTLGITTAVFWAIDPQGFVGLDWRTPLFLFTILVAVGEDYNIFLMTRIQEEQRHAGPLAGVTSGLSKTGGIISSCGVIMAGTFASLMASSLVELKQMGFALALGVLIDTLLVRPILVPAFLILYEKGLPRLSFRKMVKSPSHLPIQ